VSANDHFQGRSGSHSGHPGVQHLNSGRIERHHVGAIARRETTEPMSEAKKLRRVGRNKAQRSFERTSSRRTQLRSALAMSSTEPASVPSFRGAPSILYRDFIAVESETHAACRRPAAWHRSPRWAVQARATQDEALRMNMHAINDHAEPALSLFQCSCDRARIAAAEPGMALNRWESPKALHHGRRRVSA